MCFYFLLFGIGFFKIWFFYWKGSGVRFEINRIWLLGKYRVLRILCWERDRNWGRIGCVSKNCLDILREILDFKFLKNF